MNKENDLQHYLNISPNKLGIYLFDTKSLDKTLISLKEKCEINDVKKVIEVLLNSQSGYISDNNINDLTV